MRFLLEPRGASTLQHLLVAARAARDHAFDGLLLTESPELPAPLVAAAALAPAVDGILLASEVRLGDRHPLELAEEAAVVDVASAGRLVLVLRSEADGRAAETLDLVRAAVAARPFRHAGRHWTVPARLPQNVHHAPALARVTPAPFQPRLEIWTSGAPDGTGPRRALGHLAGADDDPERLAGMWDDATAAIGPAALGAPRARRESWTGCAPLLHRLRAGRAAFGQDWAVVSAPVTAVRTIASEVRPRVQLDSLPDGLQAEWAAHE